MTTRTGFHEALNELKGKLLSMGGMAKALSSRRFALTVSDPRSFARRFTKTKPASTLSKARLIDWLSICSPCNNQWPLTCG